MGYCILFTDHHDPNSTHHIYLAKKHEHSENKIRRTPPLISAPCRSVGFNSDTGTSLKGSCSKQFSSRMVYTDALDVTARRPLPCCEAAHPLEVILSRHRLLIRIFIGFTRRSQQKHRRSQVWFFRFIPSLSDSRLARPAKQFIDLLLVL